MTITVTKTPNTSNAFKEHAMVKILTMNEQVANSKIGMYQKSQFPFHMFIKHVSLLLWDAFIYGTK